MSQIPFRCPRCGSEQLRVSTATPTIEDFYQATCADCGAPMSEEEITKQARKIADETIKKMMSKFGK